MGQGRRAEPFSPFVIRHWRSPKRRDAKPVPSEGPAAVVGTSRRDVPGRVQRAERISQAERTAADVAPLDAARTAQRAVPTTHVKNGTRQRVPFRSQSREIA